MLVNRPTPFCQEVKEQWARIVSLPCAIAGWRVDGEDRPGRGLLGSRV